MLKNGRTKIRNVINMIFSHRSSCFFVLIITSMIALFINDL